MKKLKNILFYIGIFITNTLFAQESLSYIAVNDSMAFDWTKNEIMAISTGDRINANNDASFGSLYNGAIEHHIAITFNYSNIIYSVFVKDFLPESTEDKFGNDIFIDYPPDLYSNERFFSQVVDIPLEIGNSDKMWVPDYYIDTLISQERNKLLAYMPSLISYGDILSGEIFYWYDNTNADIQNGRAMFYNSAIKLGLGTHFAVKNIQKTNYGYRVDCVESTENRRYPHYTITDSVFWGKYNPGDSMTLFLYIDGDYLDIYVDGMEVHLGTFVKVQREFIKQYQSLIKTNTANLTNVIWPRRSDGSMDYTSPTINNANAQSSSQEIEQVVDSEINLENESPQSTENSQFPLWLFIGGGLVLLAVVGVGLILYPIIRLKPQSGV